MTLINIKTFALKQVLDALIPAVPNKPSRDILKCIKITAKQGSPEDTLTFQVTDLERFLTFELPCNKGANYLVTTEGTFAVPALVFANYARAIEDVETTIQLTPENTIKLNSGKSGSSTAEFEVGVLDIDDFPDFPTTNNVKNWIDVEADALRFGLSRVLFAVADKGHPKWGALSAVCIELENSKLSLIGTDQHRASVISLDLDQPRTAAKQTLLVSATALEIVSKIFEGTIKMSLDSANALIFNTGSVTMFVRLVNGNFPPVRNFLPKHPHKLQLDAKTFLKEIKRVQLATDQFAAIKVSLRKDKATLLAKTKEEKKTAKIEYGITNTGSDIDFTINCKYLIDVLKVGDSLELSYNKNNQPIMFKADGFEHVIVPQETR
jgi:DNA polymerase III beta subunit